MTQVDVLDTADARRRGYSVDVSRGERIGRVASAVLVNQLVNDTSYGPICTPACVAGPSVAQHGP